MDQRAFIFRLENELIEKYPVKDWKMSMKIGTDKDDELFVVGKSDIVVKKKEKMNQSYCKQSSYEYFGRENVLLGKKGNFDIRRFVVIETVPYQSDQSLMMNMNENEKKQIELWTAMKCSKVLFDTEFDSWEEGLSILNDRIIGKSNLTFLIESDDNEKFGYFFGNEINENFDESKNYIGITTDSRTFQFNLESNGRLNGMTKFEIRNSTDGGIELFKLNDEHLIALGNIMLFKQNKKEQSTVYQDGEFFENHGIFASLCGKQYPKKFALKRFIVIQMN